MASRFAGKPVMGRRIVVAILFVQSAAMAATGAVPPGASGPALPPRRIVVGVASAPPFNIRANDGSWSGISVELWREIAARLKLNYDFREADAVELFTGLAQGWLDVSVGPLTITAQREQSCDFTHSYFVSDLALAVRTSTTSPGILTWSGFVDLQLLAAIGKLVLGVCVALSMMTLIIWLCERSLARNRNRFGAPGWRGLGTSLWWTAVTMVGVGYGDIVPRTVRGRAVAICWMFISLVLVSVFTATVTSILTAERLKGRVVIQGPDDLRRLRLGTLANTAGEDYLTENQIGYRTLTLQNWAEAVQAGQVQGFFWDEAMLRYVVQTQYPGKFDVVPLRVNQMLYGFALQEGSPLREAVNRALLDQMRQPAWQTLVHRYLGRMSEPP